ncbi:hypothetical protein NM208_g11234 [Fusarium decemcellulare]|uniref:Uncharacterized protein n=1 Tax=Fusarium decemcellulare TaxID=57161 RepID=A0ACC1RV27_9HYPO|nr:hypothetical protein NM208_g11234 [Fusarium decemcellulare]
MASLFYQGPDGSIINAYFECDPETGDYTLDPDGEYKVDDEAGAPSVHEKTGLSVVELGDSGGYRVFYHDEDGRVCLMAYDDDTDWRYLGPVSKQTVKGMSVGAVQTAGVNVSVTYPHNSDNLAVAQFRPKDKNKWRLSSLPAPFTSPAPTNQTDPDDMSLKASDTFTLPSFDETSVNLAITSDTDSVLSIFYIGQDQKLHRLANVDDTWQVEESPGEKEWPEADEEYARFAVISPLEQDDLWVFYYSGGSIMQLYQDEGGTWSTAKTISTGNGTSTDSGSGSDSNGGSSSNDKTSGESDNTNSETTGSTSSGLTTGAKAGIGVGVSVGVLALGLAGFLFLRRRRGPPHPPEKELDQGEYAAVGSHGRALELSTDPGPQELPLNQKYELLGDVRQSTSETR